MDQTAESQLDSALALRRRLCADLIASEAAAVTGGLGSIDRAMATHIVRVKLKMHYLDAIIDRLELSLSKTGWIRRLRPSGGNVVEPMPA